MALRSLRALPLLLASLGAVCMEENIPGGSLAIPSSRPVQRRYSEATLASDYSRTMDHVLKKNFVEWLLARREKKSDNVVEPFKREAEPQKVEVDGEKLDLGGQGAKDFLAWLWKNKENQSFPALEGSEGLREFLEQEFVAWLMSSELCRATMA
ncbi:gastric inhibitory polypeptide [Corvus kubaryi]|uniref:gastric inhibitory polypeptide n=1 Tax=Corvus kubaryi TaxID=68294 RepID=UPI001C05D1E7|nr:gastric inhibitory polypeptide [Corvus kubaryi]